MTDNRYKIMTDKDIFKKVTKVMFFAYDENDDVGYNGKTEPKVIFSLL